MGNKANKVALGLSSRYGQQNIPNLAVTELSGQLPWDLRTAKENSALEASLASKGDTLPRRFFQRKVEQGKRAVRFEVLPGVPIASDKERRKMKCKEISQRIRKRDIAEQRLRGRQNGPDSITRLYCETTVGGKFAKVFSDEAKQILLERQTLGLVDFPITAGKEAPKRCALCHGPNSVLHTAFRCGGLQTERRDLLDLLDKTVRDGGLDPGWDARTDEYKLVASYTPRPSIANIASRRKFYSVSLDLWAKFRGAAAKKAALQESLEATKP